MTTHQNTERVVCQNTWPSPAESRDEHGRPTRIQSGVEVPITYSGTY